MADGDLPEDDFEGEYYKLQFALFDPTNSGKISLEELPNVLRMCGLCPTENECQALKDRYDPDPNNKEAAKEISRGDFVEIARTEFQTALPTKEKLKEAFQAFDPRHTGLIKPHDLRHILTNLGDKLDDEEMNLMLEEMQLTAKAFTDTGSIQYDDVLEMLAPDFLKDRDEFS